MEKMYNLVNLIVNAKCNFMIEWILFFYFFLTHIDLKRIRFHHLQYDSADSLCSDSIRSYLHPNKQEITHRSSQHVVWWLPVLAGRDTDRHTSQRCSCSSCRLGTQVYTVEEQRGFWVVHLETLSHLTVTARALSFITREMSLFPQPGEKCELSN